MPTSIPNIWQMQSRGEVDALVDALRHSEATVRKGAAAALRALGAWQAVPALEAALAAERDWQAHAAITAALQYLDRDIHIETMIKSKDIRGLTKMLNSRRVEDILTACDALGTIGDRNAVEGLVMVFRNPLLPNNARLAAAEALLKLESAPAVVTLLGALRRDNWQVRRNAAAVLGQLQAAWATDPLIKTLEDQNVTVRRTAAAALRRINSPEAIAAASAFEEAQKKAPTPEIEQPEPTQEVVPQPTQQTPPVIAEPINSAASASPMAETTPLAEPVKPSDAEKAADVPPPTPALTPQPEPQSPSLVEPSAAPAPTSFADALPTPAVFRKGTTGPLSPPSGAQAVTSKNDSISGDAHGEPSTASNLDDTQPNIPVENVAPKDADQQASSTEPQPRPPADEGSSTSQPL